MNTIKSNSTPVTSHPIKDFEGGTLVRVDEGCARDIYIVVRYRSNPANIGAIKLEDGGYLTPTTKVTPLSEGEVVELTAGKIKINAGA